MKILLVFAMISLINFSGCSAANWQYIVSGEQQYRLMGQSYKSIYDFYIDTDSKKNIDAETIQAWFKYVYRTPIIEEGPNYYSNPALRSVTSALTLDQYKSNGYYCTFEQQATFDERTGNTQSKDLKESMVIGCSYRPVIPESVGDIVFHHLFPEKPKALAPAPPSPAEPSTGHEPE